jgi:hypothetical protein
MVKTENTTKKIDFATKKCLNCFNIIFCILSNRLFLTYLFMIFYRIIRKDSKTKRLRN